MRVTNVDAQGSGQNIVIQVIGEMSTKKQPQRKFTQTFVLAEQVNGYFVLNDIFRYIVDDEEEDFEAEQLQPVQQDVSSGYQEPTATAVTDTEPHTLTNSHDPSARERDAQLIDQGLQEAVETSATEPDPADAVNGDVVPTVEEDQAAEDSPAAAAPDEADIQTTAETAESLAQEDVKQPEKPTAPEPTPAASPPKQSPAQPIQPTSAPLPAIPKATWATMAAAANRTSAPLSTQAPANTAASAPAPAAKTSPTPNASVQTTSIPAAQDDQPVTPQSSGSEWQTAARDHGKKQARPQSGAPTPTENSRAYMKNVGENLTTDIIRNHLAKFGELLYCDINRQKVRSPSLFQ